MRVEHNSLSLRSHHGSGVRVGVFKVSLGPFLVDVFNNLGLASGAIDFGTANLQGVTIGGVALGLSFAPQLSFADLDIGLAADNAIGLNFNNATLAAGISADDFDLTSTSAVDTGSSITGTTPIDGLGAPVVGTYNFVGAGFLYVVSLNSRWGYRPVRS